MRLYPFQNVAIERAKDGIKLPRQVAEALHPIEQFKEKTASVTGMAMQSSEIQVSIEFEISMIGPGTCQIGLRLT